MRARAAASVIPSRAAQAPELLRGLAVDDHQPVEPEVHAGLHEQGGVRHQHGVRARRAQSRASSARTRGCTIAFKARPRRRVREHDARRAPCGRWRRPRRGCRGPNAATTSDGRRPPGAITSCATPSRSRVQKPGAASRRRHPRLPQAMPPVSPTLSMQRPRRPHAAATVLLRSMAMVSGPTPPGTGVSAPATSRTEGACTSPTSACPFFSNSAEPRLVEQVAGLRLVLDAVHAHVHHHRPRLDVLRAHEPRPADGRDQDVGLPGDGGQVARARMADGHGGVRVHQQQGHGLAHDVAAPEHDRAAARHRDAAPRAAAP